MAFEYQRRIYGYECDIYGHLNNANYLHIFEEARSEACMKMDIPIVWLNANGISIYVLKAQIEYLKALQLEEEFTIRTTVAKLSRVVSIWKQEARNSKGELCAIGYIKGAFIKGGKPWRITQDLYDRFIPHVEEEDTSTI